MLTHNWVAPGLGLAIALLLLGSLLATGVDVFMKAYQDSGGIYQYLFLRQCLVALLLLPLFLRQSPEKKQLKGAKVQCLRANLTVIGGASAFVAVGDLSLATANVIFYTSPVITLLLAAWWFNEKLYRFRLINITLCFMGVVIALQPDSWGIGIFAGFATAICIACYNLLVRLVPNSVSTLSVMFWSATLSLPIMGGLALFNWQPWNSDLAILVVGSALCVSGYQICCIIAYRNVEAGAVAIAEYSGLVFAAIFGWLLFAEALDIWTALGILFIILPIACQSILEYRYQTKPSSSPQLKHGK